MALLGCGVHRLGEGTVAYKDGINKTYYRKNGVFLCDLTARTVPVVSCWGQVITGTKESRCYVWSDIQIICLPACGFCTTCKDQADGARRICYSPAIDRCRSLLSASSRQRILIYRKRPHLEKRVSPAHAVCMRASRYLTNLLTRCDPEPGSVAV